MTLGRRIAVVLALVVLGIAVTGGAAPRVSAQPALPYVAYGSGLTRGQVVEAFVHDSSVGRTTADAAGRWSIQIAPGSAANGDRVTFSVDGTPAGKSIEFQSGRFPAPPGIYLGEATAQAAATPAASSTPRATATPKAKPACTRNGRPMPCSAKPKTASTPRPGDVRSRGAR